DESKYLSIVKAEDCSPQKQCGRDIPPECAVFAGNRPRAEPLHGLGVAAHSAVVSFQLMDSEFSPALPCPRGVVLHDESLGGGATMPCRSRGSGSATSRLIASHRRSACRWNGPPWGRSGREP